MASFNVTATSNMMQTLKETLAYFSDRKMAQVKKEKHAGKYNTTNATKYTMQQMQERVAADTTAKMQNAKIEAASEYSCFMERTERRN